MGNLAADIRYLAGLVLGLTGLVGWVGHHSPSGLTGSAGNVSSSTTNLFLHVGPEGARATPARLVPLSNFTLAKSDQAARLRVSETYGKLPLSFETNQGQTDPQVRFLSRGRRYSLFLTSTEAVLVFNKRTKKPSAVSDQPRTRRKRAGPPTFNFETANSKLETVAVRMKLFGANPQPQIVGKEELPGKSNYFIGNDPDKWRTNVTNYKRVEYQDVYPGINMVFYGNQRQLEYDLVVSPGADPSAIKLAFEGADRVEADSRGDLVFHTSSGEIHLHKPSIYQEIDGVKKEISGHYVLNPQFEVPSSKSQLVSFQVAAYDASRPVIIDPVLSYSTYLGGSSADDQGFAIAVDTSGNAYVTGVTGSTDFPVTVGSFQTVNAGGGEDIFVAKLNPAGSALVYSTYLGGRGDVAGFEIGFGIAVDSAGNAYVAGATNSADFPTTTGAFQTTFDGGFDDAFVTKLNPTGDTLVYSTYLGGTGFDQAFGLALDSFGNAYVTGSTVSSDFPTVNAFQATFAGSNDAFVVKVNPTGSALIYSTYLGGSGQDESRGIAVDSLGNAYVTGLTSSTDFPTVNPIQATFGGLVDAFVAKLNTTGSVIYSSYLGGDSSDIGWGIAVDSLGNVYVSGATGSTNFPMASPFQPALSGPSDAFVAKLNSEGSALLYSTYLGGSGADEARGIAVDSSGNAYVTGSSQSTDFPTASPVQSRYGGGDVDAFVTKLDPTGSALVFSTYLGGRGTDFSPGAGIAVDSSGNAYVTGLTDSNDFPMTRGALQTTLNGSGDAFVAKISAGGLALSVEFVDPVPDLLEGSTVSSNPTLLANLGKVVAGIAADGVAQVVLRVKTDQLGTVELSLVDRQGPGAVLLSPNNLTGSLRPVTSEIKANLVAVPAEDVSGMGPMAFAAYHAPLDFASDPSSVEAGLADRQIFIKAKLTTSTGETAEATRAIRIVRPPVVLVHGLWSDRDTWLQFQPLLFNTLFRILRVNYPSDDFFLPNAARLQRDIVRYIDGFKNGRNPTGTTIAAIQADIVSHSMGGNVTRTMVIRRAFLRGDNYGRGDIHKLITIDTPHLGSHFANRLLDSDIACKTLFGTLGGRPVRGAIEDLAVGSFALTTLQNTAYFGLPANVIVGRASTAQEQSAEENWRTAYLGLLAGTCSNILPSGGFQEVFGGDSDLVVSLVSQAGVGIGFSGEDPPGSISDGLIHSVDPTLFTLGPDALSRDIIAGQIEKVPTPNPQKAIDLLNSSATGFFTRVRP